MSFLWLEELGVDDPNNGYKRLQSVQKGELFQKQKIKIKRIK